MVVFHIGSRHVLMRYHCPNTDVIMKTKRKLVPKSNAVSNTLRSVEENVVFRDLCHNVDDVGPSIVPKKQFVRQPDLESLRSDENVVVRNLCHNIDGAGPCDNIDGVGPSVSSKRVCVRQLDLESLRGHENEVLQNLCHNIDGVIILMVLVHVIILMVLVQVSLQRECVGVTGIWNAERFW
ncbi:hypothetical protein Tco_0056553 [Tanacetum coccineum]